MRILIFLGKSVVALAVLAVIVSLIGREVLLVAATAQIKSDLTRLRRMLADGEATQICQQKGTVVLEGEEYASGQLRFESDREYVLEIICGQFSFDPAEISRTTLVPLAVKVPGQSGIVWGDGPSGVELEVMGRRQTVAVVGEAVVTGGGSETLGNGPLNSCSGFGFICCHEESQAGIGSQLTQVADCPRSCFSSCSTRPVILAFTSQPFFDPRTREAVVAKGEVVTFAYVIDGGRGQSVTASISFGDGKVETMVGEKGEISHTYACSAASCAYTATLSASDDRGIVAAGSVLDSIKIMVR